MPTASRLVGICLDPSLVQDKMAALVSASVSNTAEALFIPSNRCLLTERSLNAALMLPVSNSSGMPETRLGDALYRQTRQLGRTFNHQRLSPGQLPGQLESPKSISLRLWSIKWVQRLDHVDL